MLLRQSNTCSPNSPLKQNASSHPTDQDDDEVTVQQMPHYPALPEPLKNRDASRL